MHNSRSPDSKVHFNPAAPALVALIWGLAVALSSFSLFGASPQEALRYGVYTFITFACVLPTAIVVLALVALLGIALARG